MRKAFKRIEDWIVEKPAQYFAVGLLASGVVVAILYYTLPKE